MSVKNGKNILPVRSVFIVDFLHTRNTFWGYKMNYLLILLV